MLSHSISPFSQHRNRLHKLTHDVYNILYVHMQNYICSGVKSIILSHHKPVRAIVTFWLMLGDVIPSPPTIISDRKKKEQQIQNVHQISLNASLFSSLTVLWWRGLLRLCLLQQSIFTVENGGNNDWTRSAIVWLQTSYYGLFGKCDAHFILFCGWMSLRRMRCNCGG